MASTTTMVSKPTTVLLFGPQALSFQEQPLKHLRTIIRNHSDNEWMRTILDELPHYIDLFTKNLKGVRLDPALDLLSSIGKWLDSDGPLRLPERLPNIILTPLVVLSQLAQYVDYVEIAHTDAGFGQDRWSPQLRPSETLGFCTGFLSALAVSFTSSKADFKKYGATAVRLATLIGAFVDAEDDGVGLAQSVSISAAWNSPDQREKLNSLIAAEAEAYISVLYDTNRATITASSEESSRLQQRLRNDGIVASEIALRGRFHYIKQERKMQDLYNLCDSLPELQFPIADKLVIPALSTTTRERVREGKLHEVALRDILSEPCHWYQTFETIVETCLADEHSLLVAFGYEKCIPLTYLRHIGDKIVHMDNLHSAIPKLSTLSRLSHEYLDDDIAVVGMACKGKPSRHRSRFKLALTR